MDESVILAGHFQATRTRFAHSTGLVLVLHDTTELSYRRTDTKPIGKTRQIATGREPDGRPRMHTLCGLLMHSSLVVTCDGLPLGLAAIKFWTRKKFKGTNALKRTINPTRVPIEVKESCRWVENLTQATNLLGDPRRCVHVGDRESDIFELFCAAHDANTNFLVRTCTDRRTEPGNRTVADQMKRAERGIHVVDLTDRRGQSTQATLRVRFRRMTVLPPVGKQKRYPALSLTVIHARETTAPRDRERIEWKLVTNLPVTCLRQAAEKLDWYAMRWKIETFHKVLKSGCKAEDTRLRTAQRLTNLVAIYCIVSWRVFWLCMISRTSPDADASLVFTHIELQLLDQLDPKPPPTPTQSVLHYLHATARLGGYLSRARDQPPGNKVIWRGFIRLMDIHLGFCLGARLVGN